MAALADALVAHAPPERPIAFAWPDAIHINHGLVGGGQLAWPDGPEDQPPPWLVFGGMIRTVSMAEGDPGLRPLSAALEEEGFDDLGSGRLVESFARHLMVQLDAWQEFGFSEIAKNYLARLEAAKRACAATSTRRRSASCAVTGKVRGRAAARWCRRSQRPLARSATRGPR